MIIPDVGKYSQSNKVGIHRIRNICFLAPFNYLYPPKKNGKHNKNSIYSGMRRPVIISSGNELIRVFPERIVYISSDGNYSTMILHDKTEHLFTMNLSHFQKLIESQLREEASTFIRIGKSIIINRVYIYKINVSKQQLVLSDILLNGSFTLTASKEALKQLKVLIENEANQSL